MPKPKNPPTPEPSDDDKVLEAIINLADDDSFSFVPIGPSEPRSAWEPAETTQKAARLYMDLYDFLERHMDDIVWGEQDETAEGRTKVVNELHRVIGELGRIPL